MTFRKEEERGRGNRFPEIPNDFHLCLLSQNHITWPPVAAGESRNMNIFTWVHGSPCTIFVNKEEKKNRYWKGSL